MASLLCGGIVIAAAGFWQWWRPAAFLWSGLWLILLSFAAAKSK